MTLPAPLGAPFASLGKPVNAFICNVPECEHISTSRKGIRLHCNRKHDWRSSAEEREHWHSIWVQTFFKSAGLQRYFTVTYNEEETGGNQEDNIGITPPIRSTIDVAETIGTLNDTEVVAIAID